MERPRRDVKRIDKCNGLAKATNRGRHAQRHAVIVPPSLLPNGSQAVRRLTRCLSTLVAPLLDRIRHTTTRQSASRHATPHRTTPRHAAAVHVMCSTPNRFASHHTTSLHVACCAPDRSVALLALAPRRSLASRRPTFLGSYPLIWANLVSPSWHFASIRPFPSILTTWAYSGASQRGRTIWDGSEAERRDATERCDEGRRWNRRVRRRAMADHGQRTTDHGPRTGMNGNG
jgi:hypothetical protein